MVKNSRKYSSKKLLSGRGKMIGAKGKRRGKNIVSKKMVGGAELAAAKLAAAKLKAERLDAAKAKQLIRIGEIHRRTGHAGVKSGVAAAGAGGTAVDTAGRDVDGYLELAEADAGGGVVAEAEEEADGTSLMGREIIRLQDALLMAQNAVRDGNAEKAAAEALATETQKADKTQRLADKREIDQLKAEKEAAEAGQAAAEEGRAAAEEGQAAAEKNLELERQQSVNETLVAGRKIITKYEGEKVNTRIEDCKTTFANNVTTNISELPAAAAAAASQTAATAAFAYTDLGTKLVESIDKTRNVIKNMDLNSERHTLYKEIIKLFKNTIKFTLGGDKIADGDDAITQVNIIKYMEYVKSPIQEFMDQEAVSNQTHNEIELIKLIKFKNLVPVTGGNLTEIITYITKWIRLFIKKCAINWKKELDNIEAIMGPLGGSTKKVFLRRGKLLGREELKKSGIWKYMGGNKKDDFCDYGNYYITDISDNKAYCAKIEDNTLYLHKNRWTATASGKLEEVSYRSLKQFKPSRPTTIKLDNVKFANETITIGKHTFKATDGNKTTKSFISFKEHITIISEYSKHLKEGSIHETFFSCLNSCNTLFPNDTKLSIDDVFKIKDDKIETKLIYILYKLTNDFKNLYETPQLKNEINAEFKKMHLAHSTPEQATEMPLTKFSYSEFIYSAPSLREYIPKNSGGKHIYFQPQVEHELWSKCVKFIMLGIPENGIKMVGPSVEEGVDPAKAAEAFDPIYWTIIRNYAFNKLMNDKEAKAYFEKDREEFGVDSTAINNLNDTYLENICEDADAVAAVASGAEAATGAEAAAVKGAGVEAGAVKGIGRSKSYSRATAAAVDAASGAEMGSSKADHAALSAGTFIEKQGALLARFSAGTGSSETETESVAAAAEPVQVASLGDDPDAANWGKSTSL